MTTWKKTKYVGVRCRESETRRHRGRPEKYYSIRYKLAGKTVEEGVGWESAGITPQYCSNLRGELVQNAKTGQGVHSLREKRDKEEARKRAEKSQSVTLENAFQEFLSTRQLKARTIKDYQGFMGSTFSDWGKRTIKDITRDMVSRRHKRLGEEIGHAQANQAFRFLRSLFNYCAAKFEDVDGSPLVKFNPVLILTQTRQWFRVNRKQTIIKNKDLPKWFKAVIGLKSPAVRDYILTILLTGLRRNEALALDKNMIDLEERTLTLLDTKNNKPFLIPIPDYLHKVLKARIKANPGSKYIFPSRVQGRHMTKPQSGIDEVIKASKVEFCSHDLRRLFVTTAEALDLSPFVIKRLVNHAIGTDTTSGYIVSDLERLRGPIQKIEDKILSIAKAKEPGKVVKIKSA